MIETDHTSLASQACETRDSGGFRVVPRVPWNPSFMKVLYILYYDKLTRSVGPVDQNLYGTPLPYEQQNYSDCSSLISALERLLVA